MSEEQKEQPVVDANEAEAKPGTEGADARQDDLDTLLAEYDRETDTGSKVKPEQKAADGDVDLRKEIETLRNEMGQREFRSDMKSTIADIRGDLDPDAFDDDLMEAWLDAQARRDERLQRAWLDRHDHPQRFNRVKAELARKFSDRFNKLPNREATEDVEAVTAHVRGASNKAPEGKAPDYSRMNNAEFRQSVIDEHGYDPGV